jgi:ribosomal protein S6
MHNKYELKKFQNGHYQHIGFSATRKNAKKMARITSKKNNNVRVYCNRTGIMLDWYYDGKKYRS